MCLGNYVPQENPILPSFAETETLQIWILESHLEFITNWKLFMLRARSQESKIILTGIQEL